MGAGLKILCSSRRFSWRREMEPLLSIVIMLRVADGSHGAAYPSTRAAIAPGSLESSRERKEETAVIDEEGQVGRLAVLTHGSPEALQRWP